MPFAECTFIATRQKDGGCVVNKIYPKEMAQVMGFQLPYLLFPVGCDMRNACIRFFIGKKYETTTDALDVMSNPVSASILLSARATSTGITKGVQKPVILFLYNNSLNLAVLNTESGKENEIQWQCSLEELESTEQVDAGQRITLILKDSTRIILRFATKAMMDSFSQSLSSFQTQLRQERPTGIVPPFSRLYYGCGVVFQMTDQLAMLGVISNSIYAFSSLELFLLRVLHEDNTSLLKKLYHCLNSSPLPSPPTPLLRLQAEVQQLYFTIEKESLAGSDPRCSFESHRLVIPCEWQTQMRIPFGYSQIVTQNMLLVEFTNEVSSLLYGMDYFLFVLLEGALCGANIVLFSSSHSVEQIQNILLTFGQFLRPFIPFIFSHLLLLTDTGFLNRLKHTNNNTWFIAGVAISDMHRYTSLYDLCFDLGAKKLYTNDAWRDRIAMAKKSMLQDRRLCSDWMEYYSQSQSEFGLLKKIQSYLRVLVTFVVDESMKQTNPGLFYQFEDRVVMIRKSRLNALLCEAWNREREERVNTIIASEVLVERSRHSDISLQTMYDAVFKLKYAEYLSSEVLENIYYDIELLTKEHKYVLHLIVALYSFDADVNLLLRGMFSASEVVQARALRIFNEIRAVKPTEVFTMNISPILSSAFSQ